MVTEESLGEFFKQVRETKGLTLEEVALKTRIQPDYLKALEEENYGKLPDQVFAKGFVRTYARSMGLDEDDALRRFQESAGAFYENLAERDRLRQEQAHDELQRKTNRRVLVATLGVALIGMIFLFSREQSTVVTTRPAVAPEPPPVSIQPLTDLGDRFEVPAADPLGAAPGREHSLPEQLTTNDSLEESGLGVGAIENEPLVLDVEATELSWVVVQVDGASPHEALLRPGDRLTWKARDRFTVTLGNAGGVRIQLNGETQGPFGPSGAVVRDIVLLR
ncbi:MAG: helix-turn-helix domain-containing protein [Nitrospiraceae bacterium]